MAITMSLDRKIANLKMASRYNKKQGNTVLSKWMAESAEHFERVRLETINNVERMLDDMPLGVYTDKKLRRTEEFAHDWYDYEEEYEYNFCGDN